MNDTEHDYEKFQLSPDCSAEKRDAGHPGIKLRERADDHNYDSDHRDQSDRSDQSDSADSRLSNTTSNNPQEKAREIGGRKGLDPVRYGDWEKHGRCIDF